VPTKVVRYEAPKVREAPRPLRKPDAFATAPPTSTAGSSRSAAPYMMGQHLCWAMESDSGVKTAVLQPSPYMSL